MGGAPVVGGGLIRLQGVLRGSGITLTIPIIPIALTAPIVLAAPIAPVVLIILAVLITLIRVWPGRRYGSGCTRSR
ncbi:hypothetical protein Aple_005880 [Acrocarpospora pleiomorpha]|uniref:Uncharacterized protein n=1 Tax=Acrocarpospora pleiomorpha TaxID=90975 RepID=A0A5M3XFF5_9ACTN|nr:hypothetical protein Aple_005880 [Acrocarpospora pleiomorpha]